MSKHCEYITRKFEVLVDETKTLENYINQTILNSWHYEIDNEHFSKPRGGMKTKKILTLFFFDNFLLPGDLIIKEMNGAGYKPGTIWDLIGLANKEPDLQNIYPIIGLGSGCKISDDYTVPLITFNSSIDLIIYNKWDMYSRFLAVRK